jgi:hypothetical protein
MTIYGAIAQILQEKTNIWNVSHTRSGIILKSLPNQQNPIDRVEFVISPFKLNPRQWWVQMIVDGEIWVNININATENAEQLTNYLLDLLAGAEIDFEFSESEIETESETTESETDIEVTL